MNFHWLWNHLEQHFPRPARARSILHMNWNEFVPVMNGKAKEAQLMIEALYDGDLIVLKGAFSEQWMRDLKLKTVEWTRQRPSEFHKMLDGSPDFHRIIDHETGLKYAFRQCKHSAYFYNWNSDPLGILDDIYERWAPIKVLMGLDQNQYRNNRPKDGVVDRVQVVRYPPGAGYLEPHTDPYLHQRLFISAYMSKRGIDYEGGGFYLVGHNSERIEVEDEIDVGDIAIGYATMMHGVAPCAGVCDWLKSDGRWFLSLYSNATDYSTERHTGRAADIDIANILPSGVM